ncbi:hypothetical protein PIROE2DRAFT_20306 [Piromyces sp. E2]|nr:hypothetical protein PIROE2DRAFT_20306 [Piromyces sp. E2]|eukprot:OUM65581.1 hypothetical protein PIROE2DRAFT_20306 [Piromyces sp. E2]
MIHNINVKMENTKVDINSESGSMSDGTLIIDEYNEYSTSKLYKNSKVTSSKIDDYDFYHNNFVERFYSDTSNTSNTSNTSQNTMVTYTENYEEMSYDSDLTHKNSTGTLISLGSGLFNKNQGNIRNKKDTSEEINIYEKESVMINKMLEEININNNDDDNDDDDNNDNDDDDEVDSDINKILYIPGDTRRKLCLSPLQSKIKVNSDSLPEEENNNSNENNVHEFITDSMSYTEKKGHSRISKRKNTHKKCKSDGSYLALKLKKNIPKKEEEIERQKQKQKSHEFNHRSNSYGEEKHKYQKESNRQYSSIRKSQHSDMSLTHTHRKRESEASYLSSFKTNHRNSVGGREEEEEEEEFTVDRNSQTMITGNYQEENQPPIPPRGVSIFYMKNRMRKYVKSENLGKSTQDNHGPLSERNDLFKTLPAMKPDAYHTDFSTLLKRKYREDQIKILYRNDYYMQTLDDTDYESYDKALFDEQLFINVENNETECLEEVSVSKENISEEQEGLLLLNNPLDLLSKRKRNPNIISPLYQQLIDKIHKNRIERERIEKEKKEKEKNTKLLLSPDLSNKEETKKKRSQNKLHRYAIADFNSILSALKNKTFQTSKNDKYEKLTHSEKSLFTHTPPNHHHPSNQIHGNMNFDNTNTSDNHHHHHHHPINHNNHNIHNDIHNIYNNYNIHNNPNTHNNHNIHNIHDVHNVHNIHDVHNVHDVHNIHDVHNVHNVHDVHDVHLTSTLHNPNLKKSRSCSNIPSQANANSISSSTSTTSNKSQPPSLVTNTRYSNQTTIMNQSGGDGDGGDDTTISNYVQPNDYYKQYNAENGESVVERKSTTNLEHFYPYQTPTYDDYCHSSPINPVNGNVNSSTSSLSDNGSSETQFSDSTLTPSTPLTSYGYVNQDFTSYYNYNKPYNLPYTSGIDVLAYY